MKVTLNEKVVDTVHGCCVQLRSELGMHELTDKGQNNGRKDAGFSHCSEHLLKSLEIYSGKDVYSNF
jgi:hypothetical protein